MPKVIDVDALHHATVRVFVERGYDGATTQAIAARAGVNEATLYRRFGTKAGLLEAALRHVLARTPLAEVEGGGDVREDLAAIVRAYARTSLDYGDAVVTLLTEIPRHPELQAAATALLPNLQRVARILEAHQRRGALAPGDPLQSVAFLLAPVLVAGLWQRSGLGGVDAALDPYTVADRFLGGYGTSGTDADAPARDADR